jgi:NAD+ diphosphatase
MECVYCAKCGARLTSQAAGDEGPVPYCVKCRVHFFNLPKPCVLVLALNERNEVVLLRQPYVSKTHWVLIAGLITSGETAEEAVAREVREETGLTVRECRYVASYYHARNDGLMIGFFARVDGVLAKNSTEVENAKWVAFDDVPEYLREGSTGLQHYEKVKSVVAESAKPESAK